MFINLILVIFEIFFKHFLYTLKLNIIKTLKYIALIIALLSSSICSVNANHIAGGNITYKYKGSNKYDIKLTLWRECNAAKQFDDCAAIYVYKTNGFVSSSLTNPDYVLTLNQSSGNASGTQLVPVPYSPCLTPPPASQCDITEAVYDLSNQTLPPIAGGYTLLYQVYARSTTALNLNTSSPVGATIMTQMPDSAYANNSSPVFKAYPPIFICQNYDFNYFSDATDADGDSLSYNLYTPFDGGTSNHGCNSGSLDQNNASSFSALSFNSGYSPSNLLGGTLKPLKIDTFTGLLTAYPQILNDFLVGIEVKEYRNHVQIGSVKRDFTFTVQACNGIVTATVPTNYTDSAGVKAILKCSTKSVTFTNSSSPILSLTKFYWDFGVTGSTTDTSTSQTPTFVYPDTGTYHVVYYINPLVGGKCSDTQYVEVRVYDSFYVGNIVSPTLTCINSLITFIDTSHSNLPLFRKWDFGDQSYSNLSYAVHSYATPGVYTVKMYESCTKGCLDSVVTQVTITPKISSIIIPTLNCDSVIKFVPGILSSGYLWNFGDAFSLINTSAVDTPTHRYTVTGNYTIKLITYPNTGCADTVLKSIYVSLGLKAAYTMQDKCFYDSVTFTNHSKNGAGTMTLQVWDFGDGSKLDTTNATTLKHIYPPGTYQVKLWVANTTGCTDSLVKTLTIHPYPTINALPTDSASLCYLDTMQIVAHGGGTYLWQPNYSISNIAIDSPLISPDKTTLYTVQVTSPFGCVYQDTIKINVITNIQHSTSADTAICIGDTINIKAASTESGIIKYTWLNSYNISKLDTSTPKVWPRNTTLYPVLIRSGRCGNFDTVTVKVLQLATPFAGDDITICKNYNATLHAVNASYFDWNPKVFIHNSSTSSPTVFPSTTTTYYLTAIDSNRCLRPAYDSLIVYVDTFHFAEAGQDTNVVMNIPFQLKASGGKYYQWMPTTGLDDPNIASPHCTLTADQVFVVKVSDENNCYAFDTVHIYAFPQVVALMPNAFTPNGDGIDDDIIPIYAGIRRLDYFFIYDRLGEKVFSTKEMDKGWDGTYHSKPCEIGTFVYYISGIDATGNGFVQKGDIILLR
ncbi:MAG: hypothetical protein RIQ33_2229 [Bacteroidota bacterium]